MKHYAAMLALAGVAVLAGCQATVKHEIETKPIKIEPIEITVNINIRVDRELDDFFDFQDKPDAKTDAPPAKNPNP